MKESTEQEAYKEITILTKEVFMKKFSPISMAIEFRKVQSVTDAIEADPNALSYYSKHVGDITVIGMIEAHIVSLNESVNVKMPLKPLQMKEMAVEIQTAFYHLSMAEIFYVFRKAKKGGYGKFYSALSMPVVLDWFTQYSEDRTKHFMERQVRNHDNYKDSSLRASERKDLKRHDQIINEHKK